MPDSKFITFFFFIFDIRLRFLQMRIIYHLNLELEKQQRSVLWMIKFVKFCEILFLLRHL
jgi:hypothetical protein